MKPTIELAQAKDAPELARLCRDEVEHGLGWKWRPSALARLIAHTDIEVVVAREKGELLGFAGIELGPEDAELMLLGVWPKLRRQGLGTLLVEYLQTEVQCAGIKSIWLHVRAANDVAVRFYERVGFTVDAFLRRHYGGREDALRMVKRLSPNPESARESIVPVDLNELLRGVR